MSKQRRRVIERTAEMFALPADAAGASRMVITGNRRLLIENHHGVAEYGSGRIDIDCGGILLSITGRDLEICAMNRHEIVVAGDMEKLEFLK